MKFLLGVAMALGVSTAAQAATPLDLYEQGKYEAAVTAGRAENDAAGFATAARAELALEAMSSTRCLDCILQAQADARKAIAIDPKYSDAHVFLAIALGREGRLLSAFTVLRRGYPSLAKSELDTALAADPSNARAWAALGGWNIELVRKGGAGMAHWMFGATVDDGLAAFDKAFAHTTDYVGVGYQYALTFSSFDLDTYRAKIQNALVLSQTSKPQGVYEVFAQARAKELLAALQKGDTDAYMALVARDQGKP